MKVLIEMTQVRYTGMLENLPKDSAAYGLLKDAIIDHYPERGVYVPLINLCEMSQADMLLKEAKKTWPDAAQEIASGIEKSLHPV